MLSKSVPLMRSCSCHEVSAQPPLLRASKGPQSLIILFALQTFHHLCSLLLDTLLSFYVLILWYPDLSSVLEVRLHGAEQCGITRSLPSVSAKPDVLQDTIGPLDSKGTLLSHIQLAINWSHQIPFHGAALQPLIALVCAPELSCPK